MKRLLVVAMILLLSLPLFHVITPTPRLGKYNVHLIKSLSGEVEAVELHQNLLLVANGSVLVAYSVDNPDNPEYINSIVIGYTIFDIRILSIAQENMTSLIAVVFCGYYGVYIVNVTLTSQMSIIAQLPVSGLSLDAVLFYGSRLIVSNGSLLEINLNTWNYSLITITTGRINVTLNNIRYIASYNQYLYCGLNNGTLVVLSSTVNPGDVFSFERSMDVSDVALDELLVSSGKLYIAARGEGVYVYKLSIPIIPKFDGYCDTRGYAHRIFVFSHYMYIADGGEGIYVADLNDFNYLKGIGYHDTVYYVRDLAVKNYRIYAANSEGGLTVYLHEAAEVKGIVIDWAMIGWLISVIIVAGVSFWLSRRREE